MRGAIIGDIVGSTREFVERVTTKEFDLFPYGSTFTDDTVLTISVYDALHNHISYDKAFMKWIEKYPNRGYGGMFFQWILSKEKKPYGSKGNGAAMRVSAVGWLFDTEKDVLEEAKKSAEITHDTEEGIFSAQAVAMAIYMGRNKRSKKEIKEYIEKNFKYNLSRTMDEVRNEYETNELASTTAPESIICFLEGDSFEDSIRNAISLGGDADTLACITGSMAEAYYGLDQKMWDKAKMFLKGDMLELLGEKDDYHDKFDITLEEVLKSREEAFEGGTITFPKGIVCPKCGNTDLEEFSTLNKPNKKCVFCNHCMDIVELK